MKWIFGKTAIWLFATITAAAGAFAGGQNAQPPEKLPEGEGKEIVETVCTMCHSLERVFHERTTRQGWETILDQMLSEGAPLSDEEFDVVLNYLAKNFGPNSPK